MMQIETNKEGIMKRLGNIFGLLLLLAAIIQTPHQALAASNSIGVNPRRNYTIDPGGKVSDTLFVNNLSKTDDLTAHMEILDFKAQDQTGTPALLLKEDQPTKWSLKPYISVPQQYNIPAGTSANVPFTIAVPKNVGAGSYYSAIRYSSTNPSSGGSVSLSGSAITLVFVRVTGEAKSNLSLEKFGAFVPNQDFSDGAFQSVFGASKPKYVSYLVRNNGNIAEQPAGSIMIKDTFGTVYKFISDANPKKNLVLIGQTRRMDMCLNEVKTTTKNPSTGANVETTDCKDPSMAPGRYTATIDLLYGDKNNSQGELKQTATFWYLPAWFLLLVALIAIAIGLGVWYLVSRIKSHGKSTYRRR
jgi:hypothetical protein